MTSLREAPPENSRGSSLLLITLFLVCGIALTFLAAIPLTWQQQAVFGMLCLFLAIVVNRVWKSNAGALILSVLSAFATGRYAYYRISETYRHISMNSGNLDYLSLFFVIPLLLAEIYAFVILFLGFFQTARPLDRKPVRMPDDLALWPSIDLYIPTYNESLDVVRTTVLAAMNVDWPADRLTIYILDDGKRAEFAEFAKLCGCEYLIRPDNKHAKAGNINHALTKTKGEYIAIFDCDHVPTRSFLQVTMGLFLRDNKLAMVQTPHHFYSPDPFERNLGIFRKVPNEGSLFYGVIQNGSDYWNGAFFCGSCAVLRRTAIEQIGGIAVETVTEDAHTSLRMQRKGWNTAYLKYPQSAGLATGSLGAHIGQRIRWARGMVQIFRTDNPLFGPGLKIGQRLCYLNSMMHFFYAIPRLMFLTSPLVYLLLGCSNVYGYGRMILAYALPHLAMATLANSRVQGQFRFSFWNEVYETVLAPFILLPTTIAVISPKHGKFNVTSKSDQIDEDYFDWNLGAPYVALLALNAVGILSGVYRVVAGTASRETILFNVVWCVANSIILGAAAAVAREAKQRRTSVRIAAKIPVRVSLGSGEPLMAHTLDISRGGFRLPRIPELRDLVGQQIHVSFLCQEEPYNTLALVKAFTSTGCRLSFPPLELQEEEALVRVIFGRADAWLDWRVTSSRDRPMLSFLSICGISLEGLAAIMIGTFDLFRKRALKADEAEITAEALKPAISSTAGAIVAILIASLIAPAITNAQVVSPATNQEPAQTSAVSPTFLTSYDLASLGYKTRVRLKGDHSSLDLTFGIPPTKVVTSAKLSLMYRPSPGLAPEASSVAVELNGTAIGSTALPASTDPDAVQEVSLQLPAELLTADNVLRLHLDARCAVDCMGLRPASLWIQLEQPTSISMNGSVLAIGNNLGLLPGPFFEGTTQHSVTIPFAFADPPDTETLRAAGVLSSWFGTLADFRGARFPVSVGSIPSGNVIVFAQQSSGLLASSGIHVSSGAAVTMQNNPVDAYSKILLVTGDSGDQILAAARAIATGRFPREGEVAEVADSQMPPARAAYDAPKWLGKRSMKVLDHTAQTFGNSAIELYFRLPPDVFFGSRSYIPFRLNYQLVNWSKIRSGEIRLRLNQTALATRIIKTSQKSERQSIVVPLPVEQLFASNTLTVEFAADNRADTNADLSPQELVLNDSRLDLPDFDHYVQMPRLDLFANAGYPFTTFADLSHTTVVLSPRASTNEISLFLTLLGFFGARTGYPALRFKMAEGSQPLPDPHDNILLIGDDSSGLANTAPLLAGQNGALTLAPLPVFLRLLPWNSTANSFRSAEDFLSENDTLSGFITERLSQRGNGSTVVAFRSFKQGDYEAMIRLVAEPSRLDGLSGDTIILKGEQILPFHLTSYSYSYGTLRWDAKTREWFRKHYLLIPLCVLLIAILLISRLHPWLEIRAERRLATRS